MVRVPRFAIAAACAALSVSILSAPVYAQGRIVRRDIGFSYILPDEYTIDDTLETSELKLDLSGPLSHPKTIFNSSNLTVNSYLITGIGVLVHVPDPRKGENLDLPRDTEIAHVMDMLRELTRGQLALNFQGSAKIKVDSVDAMAISLAFTDDDHMETLRLRLIFVPKDGKQYTFLFGCLDSEFQGKVPAFEKFMNTLRWTNRQGLPPLPKPQPKTPTRPPKR